MRTRSPLDRTRGLLTARPPARGYRHHPDVAGDQRHHQLRLPASQRRGWSCGILKAQSQLDSRRSDPDPRPGGDRHAAALESGDHHRRSGRGRHRRQHIASAGGLYKNTSGSKVAGHRDGARRRRPRRWPACSRWTSSTTSKTRRAPTRKTSRRARSGQRPPRAAAASFSLVKSRSRRPRWRASVSSVISRPAPGWA